MHDAPRFRTIDTPTGDFALIEDPDGGLRSGWLDADWTDLDGIVEDPTLRPDVIERLEAYFAGEPVDFSDIETPAGPPFLRRCWDACRRIEPGRTISYAQLAAMAGGTPGAARAAGQAMRRNPLPVIVPCHRVIGSDGGLHGFAGSQESGGEPLERKAMLLAMESGTGVVAAS